MSIRSLIAMRGWCSARLFPSSLVLVTITLIVAVLIIIILLLLFLLLLLLFLPSFPSPSSLSSFLVYNHQHQSSSSRFLNSAGTQLPSSRLGRSWPVSRKSKGQHERLPGSAGGPGCRWLQRPFSQTYVASGPRCHLGQRQGPSRFVCTFCVTYPIISYCQFCVQGLYPLSCAT